MLELWESDTHEAAAVVAAAAVAAGVAVAAERHINCIEQQQPFNIVPSYFAQTTTTAAEAVPQTRRERD